MDSTAQRARDREAFREFLEKHHYAPQGQYARVGGLEEKDLDALMRGSLGPVWTWAWRNVKNTEDTEIIKRNVRVARYTIDSCKQEREEAKAKHNVLLSRKKYLDESLQRAREREQALMKSLRGVEHEQQELIESAVDHKQRELLRRAFNDVNDSILQQAANIVDEVHKIATVQANREETDENQVGILMAEYKRMLRATKDSNSVDFGDEDLRHLREFGGSKLAQWVLEVASRPHEDIPDEKEEAMYAQVEENSTSTHDALLQIQNLLRQSQAEHIAGFVKTQKAYAKALEFKSKIDQAMNAEDAPYDLWGSTGDSDPNGQTALVVETVDMQIQSQVQAIVLNAATRALDDISSQAETLHKKKEELDGKIELMNRFDDRQDDVVRQIRSKYRQNQELLDSLTRKQSRLLQLMAEETRPRIEHQCGSQITLWHKLVMDELRAFSSLQLSRLDAAQKRLPVYQNALTDQPRQLNVSVPFEDFYINQLRGMEPQPSRDVSNGYRRVAQALGVPAYSSWTTVLSKLLEQPQSLSLEETNQALIALENDTAEDRSHTIPDAHVLLAALRELREAMTNASLPQLQDTVHINATTLQHSVPELEQAIENWYHQPAWGLRLEAPSGGAGAKPSCHSNILR